MKGWSVDRAGELLDAGGVAQLLDQRRRRHPHPRRRAARVGLAHGIQHPELRDRIAAVVEGNDLALATSGAYERGRHIVDPHTGLPPSGLLSVTIAGSDLGTADAYATAAFAMGEQGPGWTATLGPTRRLHPCRRIVARDGGVSVRAP